MQTETTTTTMTEATEKLFRDLAEDARNWAGTPMVDVTTENRGNLTDLKKRGLLVTFKSDGISFVDFTAAGVALAGSMGISID